MDRSTCEGFHRGDRVTGPAGRQHNDAGVTTVDTASARHLFEQAAAALASGRPCALATVVGVRGSAYRHEGARMLIFADGTTVGAISGGCLEADVAEVAREAMRTGRPRLLCYDMTSEDDELWGLGTGCNGVVEVFVQPLAAVADLERRSARDGQAEGAESRAAAAVGGVSCAR